MIFKEIKINGAYLIDFERHEDHRGFFAYAFSGKEFEARGLSSRVTNLNVGYNQKRGTLRGLHYQLPPHEELKTVRCTMGAVYDVIVDLRPPSPTFKQWFATELTAENRLSLCIPEGCAHGYQCLTDIAEICYLTSSEYAPSHAAGVRYNDPAFAIDWPLTPTLISEADLNWPDFKG